MATLPRNYLSKKGGRWRQVRLSELAVLLYNVAKADQDPEVGYEDAQRTLANLMTRLSKKVMVDPALLESCLWSSNLLNEQGKWSHPTGRSFDEWVRELAGGDKFNKVYNLIERDE